MTETDRLSHWQNIYANKPIENVSWYQPTPEASLDLIARCNPALDAPIIDIGGGDSFLVDHLLDLGFSQVSVLDISANALERAQKRLGERARLVQWIVSDVTAFEPQHHYAIWHDRAAFHFLKAPEDIARYKHVLLESLAPHGNALMGTFSTDGPVKCSGIEIQQYDEEGLASVFAPELELIHHFRSEHPTPFDTTQDFVFGQFLRG